MTHKQKSPDALQCEPSDNVKTFDNIIPSMRAREKMMRKLCDADLAAKDCAVRMTRQLYTVWDVI